MSITAEQVLVSARNCLVDRAKLRDDESGDRTMSKIVAAFNAIEGTDLTESQGWKFMLYVKLIRSSQGNLEIDDYVDAAGYAALAGEAAAAENFEPRSGAVPIQSAAPRDDGL